METHKAKVRGLDVTQSAVAAYLPGNYEVTGWGCDENGDYVKIEGRDEAGWTLDDYVIPRLASGLYVVEVEEDDEREAELAYLRSNTERAEPRKEWIVLYAPGWPGGHQPVPNTPERCHEFAREHGGRVFWRWTSAWVEDGGLTIAPPGTREEDL